ncbi:winged helix-turn-helix domain-containing protein [Streptomyces parvus]|uniref:winged helix-turn-helix domain-containing protein n=1 Tax=Streptomyces parvus TaxID=66428 RepID=UPI0033A618BB
MVYRIHLTADDLARVRVAEAPMPLVDLTTAARQLKRRTQPARLDAWRRRSLPLLSSQARMVLSMVPLYGTLPDFLDPQGSSSPEEELERVRAIPRRRIAADLAAVSETEQLPAWTERLADDAELREAFHDGWAHLYAVLLQPYWTPITNLQSSDRMLRLRQFLTGGVETLLAQANPHWVQWKPPVLEIRTVLASTVHDLHPRGRGLLLVPSLFQTTSAAVFDDGSSQPIVTYPSGGHDRLASLALLTPAQSPGGLSSPVAALLGRTRTAVLETVTTHSGSTTTEIARLLRISPASASEHATVLREAGLIQTARHGNRVLHTSTELGRNLLNSPARRP